MGDETVSHGIPARDFRGFFALWPAKGDVAAHADTAAAELREFAVVEDALAGAGAEVDAIAAGERDVALLEANLPGEAQGDGRRDIGFRL
jgi:hypothetical protein